MDNKNIYRVTTPVIILKIKNDEFDMSSIDTCHVTLESENGLTQLIITNPIIDYENKKVQVNLTQEQTSKFDCGFIKVQMKIKLNSGSVVPSKMIKINMKEILEEEVL